MYWKSEEFTDDDGRYWLIYKYYAIIDLNSPGAAYYNGWTKETVYPQYKELVVKVMTADSEENFKNWYEENKTL